MIFVLFFFHLFDFFFLTKHLILLFISKADSGSNFIKHAGTDDVMDVILCLCALD